MIPTATGQKVSLLGPFTIEIDSRNAEVYESRGINCGIPLLGTDFLKNRNAIIDYTKREITLDGETRPLRFVESVSVTILKFDHLFEQTGELPAMEAGVEMSIETEGPPIAQRAYRAPLAKRFIIDREIDDMLDKGVISPSSSPWSSPYS